MYVVVIVVACWLRWMGSFGDELLVFVWRGGGEVWLGGGGMGMLAMRCHSVWFLLLREDGVMGVLNEVPRQCILV